MKDKAQLAARSEDRKKRNIIALNDLGVIWRPTGRKSTLHIKPFTKQEVFWTNNAGNGSPDRPSKMLRRVRRDIQFGRC